MAKPRFSIQPQRRTPWGWVDCKPHEADMWAAFDGLYGSRRLLGRYPRKVEAKARVQASERILEGPKRRYALGRRMGPRPEGQP